jgi:pimeloyl-ACP methyl ester carboxylesterase
MGGYVALEMVRRHRAKVRALILANTRAEADSPEGRTQRDKMMEAVRARGSAALVDSMLPKLLAARTAETQPAVLGHVRSMIDETRAEGALVAIAGLRDRKDSTDLLASVDVPTLVIAGEEDAIIPVDVQRALTRIPGATMEVIPGAGHLTPVEQPEAFNRAVSTFLGSIR